MGRAQRSRHLRFQIVSSVLATLGPLAAVSCVHARFEPLDLAALPDSSRYPGAAGIVLSNETEVLFREEGGEVILEETWRQRRRAFTDEGRWLYEVGATYSDLVELTGFAVRVVKPDGETLWLDRDDAHDTPQWPGWVLYDDDRMLRLDLHWLPLGSVVDLEVKTRRRDPRLWQIGHHFDSGVPTGRSRLLVRLPKEWQLEHLATRLNDVVELPPVVESAGDETRYLWERRDLPALRWEPYGPRGRARGTFVSVRLTRWSEGGEVQRGFDDVRALSRFDHELTAARAEVAPEIEAIAREALEGAPDDPREKAKRLYAWTQEHINYCAIEVGMGGWIPHPSTKTEQMRYGDCKDKANLLKSLLKTQGIDSALASIFSHQGMPRRFGLPTLVGNANHAILVVDLPGGPVLCDPTSRTVPFGRLPAGDQGADLLPSTAEGALLLTTPWSAPDENGHRFTFEAELHPGQRLQGRFTLELLGTRADNMRGELLAVTAPKVREVVNEAVPVSGTQVPEVEVEHGAPVPMDVLPVRATGRVDAKPVSASTTRFLFRLSHFLVDPVPALPLGERTQPVVLGVPERNEDHIRLKLPEGTLVGDLPPPVELDTRFGRYTLRYQLSDSTLDIHRTYERRMPVVPARSYDELRAFFTDVLTAEVRPVVLRFPSKKRGA